MRRRVTKQINKELQGLTNHKGVEMVLNEVHTHITN